MSKQLEVARGFAIDFVPKEILWILGKKIFLPFSWSSTVLSFTKLINHILISEQGASYLYTWFCLYDIDSYLM